MSAAWSPPGTAALEEQQFLAIGVGQLKRFDPFRVEFGRLAADARKYGASGTRARAGRPEPVLLHPSAHWLKLLRGTAMPTPLKLVAALRRGPRAASKPCPAHQFLRQAHVMYEEDIAGDQVFTSRPLPTLTSRTS